MIKKFRPKIKISISVKSIRKYPNLWTVAKLSPFWRIDSTKMVKFILFFELNSSPNNTFSPQNQCIYAYFYVLLLSPCIFYTKNRRMYFRENMQKMSSFYLFFPQLEMWVNERWLKWVSRHVWNTDWYKLATSFLQCHELPKAQMMKFLLVLVRLT